LHSAKGLEFGTVFLVGMEENLLPHSRSLWDAEQLAEERRLCYVGITRAKNHLYFTYCHHRWTYAGMSGTTRSRFLDDLDPSLLEVTHFEDNSHERPYPWRPPRPRPTTPPASSDSPYTLDLSDSQLDEFLDGDLDAVTFLRS